MSSSFTLALDENLLIKEEVSISISDKLIPFTEEERKALVGHKIRALISVLFFAPLMLGLFVLSYILIISSALIIGLFLVLLGIVVVNQTLSSLNKFLKLNRDLSGGQKRVIIAPVEAQDVNVSRKGRRVHGVKFEGLASYNYWVQVQGLEISVSEEQYYQYKKGDLAEVHIAPDSKRILRDIAKINDKSVE